MTPLTEFLGNDLLINEIEKIEILSVKAYKKANRIELRLKPHRFLNGDEIKHISAVCREKYGVADIECSCDYSQLELNQTNLNIYTSYLTYRLCKGQYSNMPGLVDAKWKWTGESVNISCRYAGCADIIKDNKCDDKLKFILKDELDKYYKIEINDGSDAEANSEMMRKRCEEIEKTLPQPEIKEQPKIVSPMPVPEILPLDNAEIKYDKVIRGKKIKEEIIPIAKILEEDRFVAIQGDVLSVAYRPLKTGREIITFAVTDYTSSIKVKLFEGVKEDADETKKKNAEEKLQKIKELLKKGAHVSVTGKVVFDTFDKELEIMGKDINLLEKEEKQDTAPVKRVELHMHTKMSAMDAVTGVKDLIKRAKKWGHTAIAVTDHGVAQAFPDAFAAAKATGIKVIYGIEGYLRGEALSIVYNADDTLTLDSSFVVFDIETTGLSASGDNIIEIGAVKVENGKITGRYSSFVNPGVHIPENITQITSITDDMVADAPGIESVLGEFLEFSANSVLVAHNANFDVGFMRLAAAKFNREFDFCYLDTLELCRGLFPDQKRHGLAAMVKKLNIELAHHHRAVDDAEATAHVFIHCSDMLREMNIEYLDDINTSLATDGGKKARNHHIILLAKNKKGLENLYRIISESHLKYFYRKPVIPRSLINKHREGLLIGSACEAGELYTAVLNGKKMKALEKTAEFYDYLEIQPNGNNDFLVRSGRVESVRKLEEYNRKIYELGKRMNKPVAATCDVHFMDPQDEVFRRILMDAQGFEDADNQAPLYFRTTDEMLEEFKYLGEEAAYEVVVENTNKIADMIDNIQLLPDEAHTPTMDGAEEDIVRISRDKAVSIYGEPLPEIVQSRMDKELNSIIKNGYAVLYIIAQKLVWKSLEDGYLVGSRGSVGSSFVAFLLGITEVNSLQPHYVCPKCKHSEFITDGSASIGVDMEDKPCPVCGTMYKKDGYDIPFETFLGFDGDKEPDIDLNFSGEYQPIIHKYTETLFGEGYTFKAGTIGTIAEKTAFGFVKKYFEKRGLSPSMAEIERLRDGCTGVKRTTGQHPGGIMVVPKGEDIHSFCPVQHPADDSESGIITTHFDYHSISGRLLKLDLLGHDDPTVIRMLQDLIKIDPRTIDIGDKETISIFTSTKALGVTPEEIGSEVGSYGIPEFGTAFARKMLVDTQPESMADLVRLSGLAHGTDVWLNNAQDLIKSGTITLKDAICTRDDIMTYLIYKGLEPKLSFKFMEAVRKGVIHKGKSWPEGAVDSMREHSVPEWYIESCRKIKYMFPKGHAVAYVTMALRIAYCKIHYPKEFYATYFTVRADDFDAGLMIGSKEKIRENWKFYNDMKDPGVKEKGILTILELCNEMYCRGIEFLNIDIYKSDAKKFIPTPDGILPPLNALPGLGTSAAESIVEARAEGEFFSIEELRERAKVSKSVIELMREHHCLDTIPETAQLSLF